MDNYGSRELGLSKAKGKFTFALKRNKIMSGDYILINPEDLQSAKYSEPKYEVNPARDGQERGLVQSSPIKGAIIF